MWPKVFGAFSGCCPFLKAAQAASRSKRTRQPSAVAMLTSASSEKRETRPRSRSLIRGCVTPQCLAASACVQPFCFRRAAIFCISSARDLRFAACPGVSAIASQTLAKLLGFAHILPPNSCPNRLFAISRSFCGAPCLLLESVENVHASARLQVNYPVGAALN